MKSIPPYGATAMDVRRQSGRHFHRAGHLRPAGLAIIVWLLVAAVMSLARVRDASTRGRSIEFWSAYSESLPYYLPLILLSLVLQVALRRYPSLTQDSRRSAMLFASVLFLFYPAYIVFEGVLMLIEHGQGLGQLAEAIDSQSRLGWWIDCMITMGATALHYGIASRHWLAERAIALHRQESENFQLRLTLLQSQLEPHFLFNALNSIAALVRTGDRALALEVLERLSELLRYALRASRAGMSSLRDEIDFTERYLSVQAMRHGERLQVDWQLEDADWDAIECPPLLFQPLVENALRHGIEAGPGGNRLSVSIAHAGKDVRIQISNDLDPTAPARTGNGMGLSLVRDRLDAVYGGQGSLEAQVDGDRYVATLSFPLGRRDG